MVTVHFLPESQYPGSTSNFIYKPALFDKNSSFSSRINGKAIEVPSILYSTVTMLYYVLLQPYI